MFSRPVPIQTVLRQQLCCGCGACAFISPELYSIEDVENEGRRPVMIQSSTTDSEDRAPEICPGAEIRHTYDPDDPGLVSELIDGWGPVRRLWEGHSTDDEIRFRGSSGGAITALALYGLESAGIDGVLHTAASSENPIMNETVMSRSRSDLLRTAGSRYSPASPCERLDLIEQAAGRAIFIGKPCDVTAVHNLSRIRPELAEKTALTIALFCAGTPSTAGTRQLLEKMKLKASTPLESFHYRGRGWPGRATAVPKNGDSRSLSYEESWGEILTRHVQWRCRLCADHTGEFADVAVGDPWYRTPQEGEEGRSLIVARTQRGEQFIQAAIDTGFLAAEEREPAILVASQPNLLKTRGAVWGRKLACRLIGAGSPRYSQLPTFQFWLSQLTLAEKAKSVLGTIRRIIGRRYLPHFLVAVRRPRGDGAHDLGRRQSSSRGSVGSVQEADDHRKYRSDSPGGEITQT